MNTPFWLFLIRLWETPHGGPTLPYIVGADALRRQRRAAPEDVVNIFSEVRKTESLVIRHCPDILFPIVSLSPYANRPLQVILNDKWGTNDEEKLKNYEFVAIKHIEKGEFSRIGDYPNQTWGNFLKPELNFINFVIGRHKAQQDAAANP